MKEHRVKALRVTTTNSIKRDGADTYSSLQLLRLELELRPSMPPALLDCHHGDLKKSSLSCLSCENVPMIEDLLVPASDTSSKKHHRCEHCQRDVPGTVPLLHKLYSNKLYASYVLLTGDLQSNWERVLEALRLVATSESHDRRLFLSTTDTEGNTPLLVAGRRLLKEGAFERAAQVSKLLLQAGSDPDAVNCEGRNLLSYSVHHMDDSVALTRVLLNGGASVWPVAGVQNTGSSEQCSAFAWFLRGVIRRRRLDEQCGRTLCLISEAMGEHPTRMHGHVMRTMFRHAKCYKVLGPVFYQLKISMMRYWTQPLALTFMCRRTIRAAMGHQRMLSSDVRHLGLPASLQNYITLE
ncbi:uncharacterized protein [Anabrus simplex]|uniref:uncharacterized protein n=1 Tax=Anabrus simplex TaxID=316456 RepID=UPI0034DCDBD7